MTFFHPVKTDLDLMDTELFGNLFGNQRAVGKENGPERMVPELLVDLPKMRVKQRLPSGQE
jgi:hypothetical protein